MTDQITLTPYLRELLLEEICARLNIVEYYQFILNVPFTRGIRSTFEGGCPFCRASQAFVIHADTGKYFCTACRQEGDFLMLMSRKYNRDLNITLEALTVYLKMADERRMKSRYVTGVMV